MCSFNVVVETSGNTSYTAGTGTACTDPSAPGVMHEDVRYIRPLVVVNYSGAAGTTEVDFFSVERLGGQIGTDDLGEDAATELLTDQYNFGGTGYGTTTVRTVSFTPAADCRIEIAATIVASGLDGDGGRSGRTMRGPKLGQFVEKVETFRENMAKLTDRGFPEDALRVALLGGLTDKKSLADKAKLREVAQIIEASGFLGVGKTTAVKDLLARRAAFYLTLGSVPTDDGLGQVCSTTYKWIDTVRNLDWYKVNLQADLIDLLRANNRVAVVLRADPWNQSLAITWLGGSTYGATLGEVAWVAAVLTVGGVVAAWLCRELDVLQLDADTPVLLGVGLGRARALALVTAVGLTASATVGVGVIGFVGLVAPHPARLLVGPRHAWLTPLAVVLGALMVLVSDAVGRSVIAPAQLPVGLVCALVGAPYFLWLMARMRA